MRSTAIDRRTLLALLAASASPWAVDRCARAGEQGHHLFVTARREADGAYTAVVFDEAGRDLLVAPLGLRGHGAAIDRPRRRAVLFTRSPGTMALAMDLERLAVTATFSCPDDRHFYGHGAFTPDGRLLYATENDFEAGAGVLGIYDATDGFSRIGEIPTFGVGPHEMLLAPDGLSLIVANGGILTHPDGDRVKLNLESMKPSLVRLSLSGGDVLDQAALAPDLHRLSIRHLALDASGALWFGCQWEGEETALPPLVGRWSAGSPLQTFALPDEIARDSRNYVGSVAASEDGGTIATSCPKGGFTLMWDAGSGSLHRRVALADGCGIAAAGPHRMLLSSGEGDLIASDETADAATPLRHDRSLSWDNHIFPALKA